MAELYLGPRQRKQVLQNDENKENRGNAKRKQADSGDESKTDGESPHKKKKKGEKLKGFNDNEIRRFIKSYKKFAQPLTRMQDIAQDADLMDKQVNELVDLGRHVREVCFFYLSMSIFFSPSIYLSIFISSNIYLLLLKQSFYYLSVSILVHFHLFILINLGV